MIMAVIGVDKNVTPGAIICLSSITRPAYTSRSFTIHDDEKFVAFLIFLMFSSLSAHFNAELYTLNIHVKSHDDECGVTFMIK